ncbi:MAG: carboxypeptidase-like regulatory domain-containing protein [Chitinophagales bacterium]|nr:hypothetical protein [Chitinophagaceae bacterium]MCZ2299821.1 carboxypeptidase-like regulatory domain-containing protein [Chitinophagales bacterium]
MKSLLLFAFAIISLNGYCFTLTGTVKEKGGASLPYASVLIKGTSRGTTANSSFHLMPLKVAKK